MPSIPSGIATVVLTGRYIRPDGTPLMGTLTFKPPAHLTIAGADIMSAGAASVELDATGSFAITLIATDDPGVQPSDWAYTVTEQLHRADTRTYPIKLPSTTPVVDLADIAPTDPDGGNYVVVQGPPGRPGSQLYSGTGAPASSLGVSGDYYIDTTSTNTRLYGPKGSTDWPSSSVFLTDQGAAVAALTARVTTVESNAAVAVGKTLALGNVSGSVVLDLAQARTFSCTLTGPTVFSFANWPAGQTTTEPTIIATQDATGGRSMSFTNVTWLPSGSPPAFQLGAGQVNVVPLFSSDNGTTVYGQGGSATGGGFGTYGDGSDGAVVLDGVNTYPFLGKSGNTYWLTRDTYLASLTIASGVTLQTGGGGTATFRLFCSGTISIGSGAFLASFINTAASGATGGTNLATGTLVPGANGPNGTTGGGVVGTNVSGANGGFGGRGGNASGGATTAGVNGVATMPTGASLPRALPWASAMSYLVAGVVGYFPGGASGSPGAGDGTNAGGGAGQGGNPLWVAALNIVNNGTIQSRGGNGGAATGGNAGGGGGGQGGPVVLIYGAYSGSGSISSLGGNGGASAGTGTAGASGGSGWIVRLTN
ncbi:hypothetical protein ACFW08_05840 [Streptomyces sp. NPDC058960]|uniref:hypothetical protein n=1 Tax=Streptomyces sp. NPDC058960 TaxID=3346679 RepID=UPI00369F2C72